MSACAMSCTGNHQFDWPAGWEWWSRDGWCYYCGDTTKEKGSDALAKEHVTATETNTNQGVNSMSNAIKTPKTVRELGEIADNLGIKPTEVMELIASALGDKWWEHGLGEVTFTATKVPHGFTPSEVVTGLYTGEQLFGDWWSIRPEWLKETGEFSLVTSASEEEPRTAAEARTYANALLQMADYITAMENNQVFGMDD